jgi:tripartite-type tricarboxylate transporter receptor subunit TctC
VKPVGTTPEEFKRRIDEDYARWQQIIRQANISIPN